MKNTSDPIFWLIIVFALLGTGATVYSAVDRASCRKGHYENTGRMACFGNEFFKSCSPTKDFVCDVR